MRKDTVADAAVVCLLFLSSSSSSSSSPWGCKEAAASDVPQTIRSSNRDRRRPGPARTPLSVFFSSARDEKRPVRLTEALQHYPSSNQEGVLRKRTFSGHHLQNNNKRS